MLNNNIKAIAILGIATIGLVTVLGSTTSNAYGDTTMVTPVPVLTAPSAADAFNAAFNTSFNADFNKKFNDKFNIDFNKKFNDDFNIAFNLKYTAPTASGVSITINNVKYY